MKEIDCTPTWRALLPALVNVAANGTDNAARKVAMDELYRLADTVDQLNAKNFATDTEPKAQ